MRDFRDAKAMAQTLRAALEAKGIKLSVGQSLEMIAKLFGVADWNTLSAAINARPDPIADMALEVASGVSVDRQPRGLGSHRLLRRRCTPLSSWPRSGGRNTRPWSTSCLVWQTKLMPLGS